MSDNYALKVLELDPPRAVIEWRCVHPDVHHPDAEYNVAVQILIEAWSRLRKPEHPRGELLQELQDLIEGVAVEISKEEWLQFRRGEKYGQYGELDGGYFKKIPDLLAFSKRSIRQLDEVDYEVTGDSPREGIMTLVVRDPQLLDHLNVGLEWVSVAYNVLPYLRPR